MSTPEFPPGDYVSPNLERVRPDHAFPNMVIGDTSTSAWPHLRRNITHNWYVDRRVPTVGFVSRDEAAILYNTARVFDGRPCLEIGCWRGWSTVHIALGTHSLDSVDPILGDPAVHGELVETLRRAGVEDRVRLHSSRSPEGVKELAERTGKRWSFVFVDGDHEGDSPLLDAEVVHRFAADDALIILHDLAAPGPAAALAYLRDQGWTTAVYQTMQVLGVATRGGCRAVAHIPDPSQHWSLPDHLNSFAVIGESHRTAVRRIIVAMGRPTVGAGTQLSTDAEELERAAVGDALCAAEQIASELLAAREGHRLDIERRFNDLHVRFLSLSGKLAEQDLTRARLEADVASMQRTRDEALEEGGRLRAEQIRLLRAVEHTANELRNARDAHRLDVERSFRDFHAYYLKFVATLSDQKVTQAKLEADLADAWRARDEALARGHHLGMQEAQLEGVPGRSVSHRGLNERQVVRLLNRTSRLSRKLQKARADIAWFRSRYVTAQVVESFAREICRPRVLLGLARRSALGREAETRQLLATAFSAQSQGAQLPSPVLTWLARPRTLFGLLRRQVLAEGAAEGVLTATLRARLDPGGAVPREKPAPTDSERALARVRRRLDKVSAELAIEHGRAEEIARKLSAVEHAMVVEQQALYDAQIELTKLRRGAIVDDTAIAPEVPLEIPR